MTRTDVGARGPSLVGRLLPSQLPLIPPASKQLTIMKPRFVSNRTQSRRTSPPVVLLLALGLAYAAQLSRPVPAQTNDQVTAEDVNAAISRGITYLRNQQDPRGRWHEQDAYPGGVTALCTLALINSGVALDDPMMRRAMAFVRRPKQPRKTYSVSLETMVLCAADPDADRLQIRENVTWLQKNQIASGSDSAGAWSYGELGGRGYAGDPSNTQFALLALHEAERVGVTVSPVIWRRSLGYWTRIQRGDGSWGYDDSRASMGSITCAGIASTIIALGQVTESDARVDDGRVLCCQPQADQSIPLDGLAWLADNFSVVKNPTASGRNRQFSGRAWYYYYLYALERVGRMTANRFIGQHDWYREGAETLVEAQDATSGAWIGSGIEATNPDVATAMALLFLSKGKRPVAIAKYQSQNPDWNRHRHDVGNLTGYVEKRWQRDLTWQVIDGRVASVEDLLQTPVLYISGRDKLELRADQKLALKQYVDQGGFVFAESCCEGGQFEEDFGKLMKELFPGSPLRLLPVDHPIWYAEQRIPEEYQPPLLGLDACCRTSVVYCPGQLSCYWELGQGGRDREFPESIQKAIAAKLGVGANVLTYATNRELKEKLDVPLTVSDPQPQPTDRRGTLYVAKLRHGGGSDDAPAAFANLLEIAGETLQLRINPNTPLVSPAADNLFDYPIVFVHGRRAFRWSATERNALAEYVQRGGFILADSICSSDEFSDAFRREMRTIFPNESLQRVPVDHPLLSRTFQGYDLDRVQLRNPQTSGNNRDAGLETRIEVAPPNLEAIEVDGRLAVVFSPYDLSCALENQASITCRGYVREDAVKIGINCLLYAMGL